MQKNYLLYGLTFTTMLGVGTALYLWFAPFAELSDAHRDLQNRFADGESTIATLDSVANDLRNELASTSLELSETKKIAEELADSLRQEKERNEDFEDQIKKITGTVGKLDKLAKTDPELLQKYSKVYFLNEHYTPPRVVPIKNDYLYRESEPEFLHTQVMPFFEEMMEEATEDGITLWALSAFRSFDEQASLKGRYLITYGSGANTFSADQGYSEHQLGTTVDFTTEGLGGGLTGFENTPAYTWLLKHAHAFGFVLSYPENNSYYIYEPWHWRFVGTELAEDLQRDDKHFYDLDQRELDEYLISIFD